jgi:hypothetical protein
MAGDYKQSWFQMFWSPRGPTPGRPSSWKGWMAYLIALLVIASTAIGELVAGLPMVAIAATQTVLFMAFAILFAAKTGGDDLPSKRATTLEEEQDRIERDRWRHPFDLEG